MLNRRLIRIKVFQTLFAHFTDEKINSNAAYNTIKKSVLDIEIHFLAVVSFLVEFRHFVQTEQNPSEIKIKAIQDDLDIFNLITVNRFIDDLEENTTIRQYIKKPYIPWNKERDTIFIIYKDLKQNAIFNELKQSEESNRDFQFVVFFFKYLIFESVEFEQLMEEKSLVWYDEKIPILKNLERMFSDYETLEKIQIPTLSKDLDEDLDFAKNLLDEYIDHREEVAEVIDEYTPGWDSERITKIDYVLMCMALCEFKYLLYVPVKVTINEYIEIVKMYSTPQSSKFLNGTLDKILKDWTAQGLINKTGRGLIG